MKILGVMTIKFHYAEKGFSFGVENPVPLANMTTNKDYPSVGFINGITRTIWLLANGAQYFPAFVFDKEVANKLHRFFGVKGSRVLSNNELFFQLNERGFRT
ncbi:hypothetical protein MD535_22220 [Vibrio sp. ZSDZ65]|uniref:Uncharacterized protein n=1 Tax=Vibrio qingdaonensis TaxID=2829491 RepID=A0A9X3CSM9_9VIBR|nr:hypothetical protein [Vibrio qingdaonensis]MCW8348708.1 hypothetical protein [Vibrio qingdaonensis]